MADKTAYEIIAAAQKRVLENESDFPFDMGWYEGQVYRRGVIAAYQHALEMMGEEYGTTS